MECCDVLTDSFPEKKWELYARCFADYSIYQTWPYQEIRSEAEGQEISRAVVKDSDGRIRALCQVRIKNVPLLRMKIGYVQSGPLMLDDQRNLVCTCEGLKALRDAYLGRKVSVLRIVPNISNGACGCQVADFLERAGFRQADTCVPYHTLVVSLVESTDEMLARIHRDCRRILRRAEENVEIEESRSDDSFAILEELYMATRAIIVIMATPSKCFTISPPPRTRFSCTLQQVQATVLGISQQSTAPSGRTMKVSGRL